MSNTPKLTVELVPETSWCSNVRSHVKRGDWDRLRKRVYQAADNKCEICKTEGRLECHEVWKYDDKAHVQTLIKFVALCPACHSVKHYGKAEVDGRAEQAFRHLRTVNNWTANEAQAYLSDQFSLWDWRSSFAWKLNLTLLDGYGIKLRKEAT